MENRKIQERIAALRKEMANEGIAYYMVPTADFHNSEYVNDYFKMREYLCGFTGSNGTLVVSSMEAGLWTDGRYFIQAEHELEGTGVTLFRIQEEGVPSVSEYLADRIQQGEVLGFDGRVVEAAMGKKLEEKLEEKQVSFSWQRDLGDSIWEERPELPKGEIRVLSDEISGKSVEEKLAEVRSAIAEKKADAFLLSKLDDLMWLFNIRGCDVECNPVALSYGYLTMEEAYVFLQKEAVNEEAAAYFQTHHIHILEYEKVGEFLQKLPADRRVLVDTRNCSYALFCILRERCGIVEAFNPTEALKAVKNATELSKMEEVYLKDSAAVVKFIYWVKHNVGKVPMTEVTAAQYIDKLRSEIDGYLELSFPTICGYEENAAMMHYEATEECHKKLEPRGMLLVDSGGQYLGGTTDVTRTIVLGTVSEEMKKHFTAVACGMLQLSAAKFLYGCTGRNLDILARKPLWDMDIDYKCGTGHGVGYILNVHEGPQSIRWRFAEDMREAVLEEGMTVTNEPGVYREGSYGIRTENVLVVQNGTKNGDGQFMYFDTLTYAPVDLEAIDPDRMSDQDKTLLNEYHRQVREKITPYLTKEEADWLAQVTVPVR